MKKCTLPLVLIIMTLGSCKKTNSINANQGDEPVKKSGRYHCYCNTVITFVDHCGIADEYTDTNYVDAVGSDQAAALCSAKSTSTSSNYTIINTTCEIK